MEFMYHNYEEIELLWILLKKIKELLLLKRGN